MSKAYAALLAESNRLAWPVHYRTDLTEHDKRNCEGRDDARPFLWAVRECGTDFIDVRGRSDLDWALACSRREKAHYYVWTGRELVKLPNGATFAETARDHWGRLPVWNARIETCWPGYRSECECVAVRGADEENARYAAESLAKQKASAGQQVTITVAPAIPAALAS